MTLRVWAVLALGFVLACKGGSERATAPMPVLTTISVALSAATVQVGQTASASATGLDQNGSAIATGTVTWSSSSPTVATVEAGGAIAAFATGQTTITASAGSRSGQATLAVIPVPVAAVIVTPVTARVGVGAMLQFSAATLDASGNSLTGRAVTWATSDSTKARVSTTGLVTAVTAGPATITATSEGKSGIAAVTIPIPVASVSVSPASVGMVLGGAQQLAATALDAGGGALTNRSIVWAASDSSIVRVSPVGLVTAIAVGIATVNASSEGKVGAAAISIVPPPMAGCDPWPSQAADMLARLPLPAGICLVYRPDISGVYSSSPPRITYGPLYNPNGALSTLGHELGHAHQDWLSQGVTGADARDVHNWIRTREGREYLSAGGWQLDSLNAVCAELFALGSAVCWTQNISFCEFSYCHTPTAMGGGYPSPSEENAEFIAEWYNIGSITIWGRANLGLKAPRRAAWARTWLP